MVAGPFSNMGVPAGVSGKEWLEMASAELTERLCSSPFLGCGGSAVCLAARCMSLSASAMRTGSQSGRIRYPRFSMMHLSVTLIWWHVHMFFPHAER